MNVLCEKAIDASIESITEYFNSAAASWDSHCCASAEKIRALLSLCGIRPHARIMDVACGTGVLFPFLLPYSPELLRAVDISPEMIRIAASKHDDPRLVCSVEDFYEFNETGFDYVIVYNAYPHFLDKERFARQAYERLNPGGRLVIAHGLGRERINRCHSTKNPRISGELLPCAQEARLLGSRFCFDRMVDTEDMYLLSGTAG
jgi:demethylmenaquinone methyltransferase/2-methoxy-6-polyprenyl-1,4-benzoquinol methylase